MLTCSCDKMPPEKLSLKNSKMDVFKCLTLGTVFLFLLFKTLCHKDKLIFDTRHKILDF
jgi:hypothetical protein